MNEKVTAKQRMIYETVELLCKGKMPNEITVADIAKQAKVGNGMVNYHFQSKENLIQEAIKEIINRANKTMIEKLKPYSDASAVDRLAAILKEVMDFSANNAKAFKLAILDNLEKDNGLPLILFNIDAFNDCINELYKDDDEMVWIKRYTIISFLDYIHLKANAIKEEVGFDFYHKEQRDEMIDIFVRDLVHFSESNNY